MRIGIVQMRDRSPEGTDNGELHARAIRLAASHHIEYLLFPELSLTGYFRADVETRALHPEDVRLHKLSWLARDAHMTVSVGVPLRWGGKFLIAHAILGADGTTYYAKKHLHPGEETAFSTEASLDPLSVVSGRTMAHAICYDIENPEHAESATVHGAEFYSASIFYSRKGIEGGRDILGTLAGTKRKVVVMANYCGPCWGLEAGGRSALWDENGHIVVEANGEDEVLLIGELSERGWSGKVIDLGADQESEADWL